MQEIVIPTAEQIAQINPRAGDWLASLIASTESGKGNTDPGSAPDGLRGALVGRLDKALNGDTDGRYLFSLVSAGVASSKEWSERYARALNWWLGEGGEEWVPRIVEAARRVQGQEALPELDPLAKEAEEKLGALVSPAPQADATVQHADGGETGDAGGNSDGALHREARIVAWTEMYDPNGARWSITLREGVTGQITVEMCKAAEALTAYLLKRGWSVESPLRGANHRAPAPQAVKQPTAPATAPTLVPAPRPAQGGNGGGVKSGTARLEKLVIQPDGKIEFYVDGFRWPFKDARGPEVVASLFDEELQQLGWTAELLSRPAVYTPDQFGVLYVDWEKPGKYYDVVRIHT
ncbi:MAG TPA: hypothetical protein EYH32_04925 [Anaerolineae bacterium]|nr:hypothetical protein [Anaerolineae bacterium]